MDLKNHIPKPREVYNCHPMILSDFWKYHSTCIITTRAIFLELSFSSNEYDGHYVCSKLWKWNVSLKQLSSRQWVNSLCPFWIQPSQKGHWHWWTSMDIYDVKTQHFKEMLYKPIIFTMEINELWWPVLDAVVHEISLPKWLDYTDLLMKRCVITSWKSMVVHEWQWKFVDDFVWEVTFSFKLLYFSYVVVTLSLALISLVNILWKKNGPNPPDYFRVYALRCLHFIVLHAWWAQLRIRQSALMSRIRTSFDLFPSTHSYFVSVAAGSQPSWVKPRF